jgi:tetratricopeptide (TPR) repeat protein
MERLKEVLSTAYYRLLALPEPDQAPQADDEDPLKTEDLMRRLKSSSREARVFLVRVAEQFQSWALCERVCDESIREAARNVEEAAAWAQLAQEIAERVPAPEELRSRIQGYAGLHVANAMRVAGDHEGAERSFAEAERLWLSSPDAACLLDPGRRLDLKASLRRDQRRFNEALALLDEAVAVSRVPGRILINKGFTLEVMGQYGRAVETLLLAAALLDEKEEPRLHDILYLNLANNFCHLGQHRSAAELVKKVQPQVAERGDEIDLIRILWLQGRIEAGMGRTDEALHLLSDARERFAAEKMLYDVALALLEEAVLLLSQGRSAEVKVLAQALTVVFERQGVHREALAALRLFHEAAQREGATAELARDVLRYLFRARHDQGLRFGG